MGSKYYYFKESPNAVIKSAQATVIWWLLLIVLWDFVFLIQSTACLCCKGWDIYIHNFPFLGNPMFVHQFSAHFEVLNHCNDM